MNISIEPVLEATQKFGVIELCKPAPAHSKELGTYILEQMHGQEERMHKQAAAVLIPAHGIILAGMDFDKTLDAVERIDVNCYALTVRMLFGYGRPMNGI
jgi:ribulose-5-phosphate 4-epimerase/fuculose-1-phosphate aldolase